MSKTKQYLEGDYKLIELKQYGYIETIPVPEGLIPGRITDHRGSHYTVITRHGEASAVLKGTYYHNAELREDFPCVGDFVHIQHNDSGPSLISNLLPRKTMFSRADFSGHAIGYVKTVLEQVVAANFDYVFIMTSLNYDFNVNRIMRYIAQAHQSRGKPVVILTKADLVDGYDSLVKSVEKAAPDVPVHAVSAHTGHGLDALGKYFQPGKTIVFLGMSGVGKSSLLNVLMDQEVMIVKAIRDDDSRGRHTTSHRQLFKLPSGAMVIDTPGMRELGLFDVDYGLSAGFADVEELVAQCRFSDCLHQTEPKCAIRAALEDGSLSNEHWKRYQAMKRESKFVDSKSGFLQEKKDFGKSLAIWSKQRKRSVMHGKQARTLTREE